MPKCLQLKVCLRKFAHWPGIIEAGLHCLYTGFFVIEAATYGLILEQKFHGVLQIILINFYLVLLCLIFIRWNLDINSAVCHFLISMLSFILTLFVGKLILLYIDFMERPRKYLGSRNAPGNANNNSTENQSSKQYFEENDPKKIATTDSMKLDPLIVILDIAVYLLISVSYIIMLLKISLKMRKNAKTLFSSNASNYHPNGIPRTFYEIDSNESSIVSTSVTVG
ncbi:unnamed protein product [Orchesella dallaii]|uniref:Uncharacterized protein n=1 Tax=Orchesella dallaii TaxID=48710 RepID=A0ABP1R8Q7_9HEXA